MDNLVDLQQVAQQKRPQPENVEIGPNDNSLDLLQAVYRNNELPLTTRMRAAISALKHEVPALIATAIVNEQSFAEVLDRRLARLREMEQGRLIEAKAEPTPEPVAVAEPVTVEVKPPTPPIAYRSLLRRRI